MRAFAEVMTAAHAPGPGWAHWLPDDTDVCRCEEVTAGRIREAVEDLGARDARTVKLLTRAGMGWCQGRMCGPAVACLIGPRPSRRTPAERRPFAAPVPLSALAALDDPVVPAVNEPGTTPTHPEVDPRPHPSPTPPPTPTDDPAVTADLRPSSSGARPVKCHIP